MDIKEKISKVMKQAVDHCEVMGVNLLVEKEGEELLYCEEGMADRENRRLISRDTIFRLYSQTKPDSSKCYDPDGKRTFGSRGVCIRVSAFIFGIENSRYSWNQPCKAASQDH